MGDSKDRIYISTTESQPLIHIGARVPLIRIGARVPLLILVLTISVLGQSCSIGRAVCSLGLTPPTFINHRDNFTPVRKMVEGRYPGINAWYDSLRTADILRDTIITGEGGERLFAVYASAGSEAEGAVLLLHGYAVNHIAMMHLARIYRDSLRFNVLVPDLQRHGYSGGETVKMGWGDRRDAISWTKLMHSMWGSEFIVVHGISMGAATAMMMSGEDDLPDYVGCFIEDSGYTSVWDEFDYLRHKILVSGKGLQKASDYCFRNWGWDFRTASCVEQLARSEKPMLFIHGDPDDFVPTGFVDVLYAAKTKGYKEIWRSKGARKHALAYLANKREYTERVKDFIYRCRAGSEAP